MSIDSMLLKAANDEIQEQAAELTALRAERDADREKLRECAQCHSDQELVLLRNVEDLRGDRDAALGKLGEAERERDIARGLKGDAETAWSGIADRIRARAENAEALVERYGKALRIVQRAFRRILYVRVFCHPDDDTSLTVDQVVEAALAPVAPVAGQRGEGT